MARRGEPIRVGIAGQGRSGYDIHARWLREVPGQYRIVAVADQLPERRRDAEEQLGAVAYKDYRDMLRKGGFDLFVNAMPSPLHMPGSLEALSLGYHVLCEKPMAGNVRDFDRMVDAARKARRVLAPFQNNRPQPFFVKMQEVLGSGVLGRILYIRSVWGGFNRRWDWQTIQCNMGGTLFNTGPHAIDQALALFGEREEPRVFCRMYSHHDLGGDADNLCCITLHGRKSPHVEILLTSYLPYAQGAMYSVCGTLGGLSGGSSELRWKHYDPQEAPRQKFWKTWSENREYPGETLPWKEEAWTVDEAVARGMRSGYTLPSFQIGVKAINDNLHGVLTRSDRLNITLPQVRRQIAVIEECRRQNPLPKKYRKWVPGKGGVK